MDAACRSEKEIYVKLDGPEMRLIAKALSVLRYSNEPMTGSQLVDLAGLSVEWMTLCQDVGGKRWSTDADLLKLAGKVAGTEVIKC